jgi:hypothetical protein
MECYMPSDAFAEMATASKEDGLQDFYQDNVSFDLSYAGVCTDAQLCFFSIEAYGLNGLCILFSGPPFRG